MNVHQTIEKIISSPQHHARFLNTLALMELCGAQKLSRLVPHMPAATFFLEHLAEEYRHAYFLRQLAQKIAGDELIGFGADQVYSPALSRGYINNLQRHICLELKARGLAEPSHIKRRAYLLSTFAIETRALPFYQSYQSVLDKAGIGISVKSIISEEEKHLSAIKGQIDLDPELEGLPALCLALEEQLFSSWFLDLHRTILRAQQNH